MRGILAFSLLTPVLLAQAPTASPTLAQKVAAETKAIQALKLENPVEALARAKALLPATKLPFDKTSLQTAFASTSEWNAQLDTYKLITSTGIAAGRFEEVKEAGEKGRDLAKELQVEALAAFDAYKATWVKAGEESAKVLAEIRELEAKVEAHKKANAVTPKPKVSMEEANEEIMRQHAVTQRLAYLKPSEPTLRENVEKAGKVLAPYERRIKDLDTRTREFDESIAFWDKYLGEEAENIATKYKNDKVKYAEGLLRGVAPKPDDKVAALVALYRAMYLDPRNPAFQKRVDQLMGRIPTPAAKPAKGSSKKK
jgi:hypothetical protein